MGIPIVFILNCLPCLFTTPVMATNSVPKVHFSIIDCFFEYQLISAALRFFRNSVQNQCIHHIFMSCMITIHEHVEVGGLLHFLLPQVN